MGSSVTDILTANGIDVDEDQLEHYGVPGMRWGKRKARKAAAAAAEAAKPKVSDLTDDELKKRINRIKLEKEYAKLTAPEISAGRKIVGELLVAHGKKQASYYLDNHLGNDIKKLLAKQAVAAVTPAPARQVMQLNKTFNGRL